MRTEKDVCSELEAVQISIERAEAQNDTEELSYLYDELSELRKELNEIVKNKIR